MNKGNLLFRYAFLHEFFPNIAIDSERSFRVRRGLIAENHLRGLLVRGLFVNLIHVIDAKVDLAVRIIRVAWINDAGIQRGRLSLLHDNKHIIHAFTGGLICIRTQPNRIALPNEFGALGQPINKILLQLRRLCLYDLNFILWDRQFQAVCGFHIRKLLEHAHEFRDIVEPCKSRLGTESFAGRVDFHRCRFLSERARPRIEMVQSLLLQAAGAQIALHRIKFGHGV